MESTIAYLAQGRLYVQADNAQRREIVSQFSERANERTRRDESRHGWKARSEMAPSMFSSSMLWNAKHAAAITQIQINSVARGDQGEILFTLRTNTIGGLFAHNPADQSERRLYHENGFLGQNLARHATKDLVALSVQGGQMECHIAVTDTQGRRMREITEGDSRDECPSWVPNEPQTLVFQSAGIGRNAQGFMTAIGPYRVEKLNLDTGDMTTLLEDDQFDYLSPRIGNDGALYFIRRPWLPNGNPISLRSMMIDTLLFPYRLLRAIVHFSNFFSMMFSGKPILTTGGPPQPALPTKTMLLWGKMIDAEKVMKTMKKGAPAALVPPDWQLVRKTPAGQEEILARSVLSFDLNPQGNIAYTDGTTIFELDNEGKSKSKLSGNLIEYVTFL